MIPNVEEQYKVQGPNKETGGTAEDNAPPPDHCLLIANKHLPDSETEEVFIDYLLAESTTSVSLNTTYF